MKKIYLFFISLFILFIPNIVLAASDFTINSIEKVDIQGETVEESLPSINGNNINYNIRFYSEGDSTGINQLTSATPTETTLKSEPWN